MTYQRKDKKLRNDAFLLGVLVALGHIYAAGEETTAEEIVRAVGPSPLLRVANAEEDPCLRELRRTVRSLKH